MVDVSDIFYYFCSEVAKKTVSARPGPILEERSGPGWDQDGPGWPPPRELDGSEMLKNKARGESGRDPLRPGMESGRARDWTQARVWMASPRDSNRLLGLSDSARARGRGSPGRQGGGGGGISHWAAKIMAP